MEALRDDDFSAERFKYVEDLEQGLLDYNDKLVNSSFIAFGHYPLWDCMFRIWASASILGGRRLVRAATLTAQTGDDKYCRDLDNEPLPGLWCPTDFYRELFDEFVAACEEVDAGKLDAAEAVARISPKIQNADWMLPDLGFTDPSVRFIDPTPERMRAVGEWAKSHPREELRRFLAIGHQEVDAALTGARG
jgi:FADH2 O2-dependent halogenase